MSKKTPLFYPPRPAEARWMGYRGIVVLVAVVVWLALVADLGFTLQNALNHFDFLQVTGYREVTNVETGCYLHPWTTFNPDGSVFYAGSEGAAVNALLFMCGNTGDVVK